MAERMTFFRSYYEAIEELDDTIQLEVIRAIIRFGLYGEEPEGLSPYAKMAFTFARPSLEKSASKGDASRANGSKGGRPKKPTETQENLRKPTETQENLKEPVDYRHKTIDNDYKTIDVKTIDVKTIDVKTIDVKTIDNDLETKTLDNEEKKEEAKASKKEIVDALVAKWNSYADRGNIPLVRSVSQGGKTWKSILARVDENGIDDVADIMDAVFRSSFLRGDNNNGWFAKFDWIFLPSNYEKIKNGNYEDKVSRSQNPMQRQNDMLSDWADEFDAKQYGGNVI